MENTDDKVAGESPSKEEVSLEDDQDLSDLSLPDPEFPRIHDLEKIKDPSLNYKSEPIAEPATPQLAFNKPLYSILLLLTTSINQGSSVAILSKTANLF